MKHARKITRGEFFRASAGIVLKAGLIGLLGCGDGEKPLHNEQENVHNEQENELARINPGSERYFKPEYNLGVIVANPERMEIPNQIIDAIIFNTTNTIGIFNQATNYKRNLLFDGNVHVIKLSDKDISRLSRFMDFDSPHGIYTQRFREQVNINDDYDIMVILNNFDSWKYPAGYNISSKTQPYNYGIFNIDSERLLSLAIVGSMDDMFYKIKATKEVNRSYTYRTLHEIAHIWAARIEPRVTKIFPDGKEAYITDGVGHYNNEGKITIETIGDVLGNSLFDYGEEHFVKLEENLYAWYETSGLNQNIPYISESQNYPFSKLTKYHMRLITKGELGDIHIGRWKDKSIPNYVHDNGRLIETVAVKPTELYN